jgi:NADH-quinone oxidoreductase subunit M
MAIIGIVSIIYGALACLAQTDLKKMVAYSSISHMGIVMLGIATLSELGVAAAVFQMFAHGLITAVLFMTCGMFQHKAGTREIPLLGGLAPKMPIVATVMMIGFMASLGLPGMVGFLAEFSVFTATYDWIGLWVLIPMISVALTAAYYLWAMQRTIFGDLTTKIDTHHIHDAYWFEIGPLAVLIGLIVLYGVWPALIMDYIVPSIPRILSGVI